MIGRAIARRYRVTGRIAVGERAILYRARRLIDGRPVVLKVLRPELAENRNAVLAIFREARAMQLVGQACAPALYDVGWHGAIPFLAMERLVGTDLMSRTRGGRASSLPGVITIARGVAEAVAAVHRAGIVHRDLKPDNIVVSSTGRGKLRVTIVDFETAVGARLGKPAMRGQIGTLLYAAPELSSRRVQVDARADIYSFGCILFQIAYRHRSFERASRSVSALGPEECALGRARTAYSALARLCRGAMSPNRRFRPRTMDVVIAELCRIEALAKRARRRSVRP